MYAVVLMFLGHEWIFRLTNASVRLGCDLMDVFVPGEIFGDTDS